MAAIDSANTEPALARSREMARRVYVYGIWLLFASIIMQFFLAGLGVLDNPAFFYWHAAINGAVVGLLPLVLVGIGAFGRVPGRTLWLTAAVFGLVVLQSVLISPYRSAATGWVRAIAGLHVVNGLLVFWVGLKLLERTTQLSNQAGRRSAVPPLNLTSGQRGDQSMARVGDVLEAPASGEKLVVLQLGDDARGLPVRIDGTIAAHASGPPEHIHPSTEETFEVQSGRLNLRVAGKSRVIGPGEKLVIPPGTPHRFWNEGDEEVRVLGEGRPGQRLLNYFEALFPVVARGRINPLRLAVVLREYQDVTYLVRPPLPVQKVVLGVLAPIGRLLGYRA